MLQRFYSDTNRYLSAAKQQLWSVETSQLGWEAESTTSQFSIIIMVNIVKMRVLQDEGHEDEGHAESEGLGGSHTTGDMGVVHPTVLAGGDVLSP